jgi:hypothetical protein
MNFSRKNLTNLNKCGEIERCFLANIVLVVVNQATVLWIIK